MRSTVFTGLRGDERAGVRATHTSDPFDLRKRYATPPHTSQHTVAPVVASVVLTFTRGHERDKAPLPDVL